MIQFIPFSCYSFTYIPRTLSDKLEIHYSFILLKIIGDLYRRLTHVKTSMESRLATAEASGEFDVGIQSYDYSTGHAGLGVTYLLSFLCYLLENILVYADRWIAQAQKLLPQKSTR